MTESGDATVRQEDKMYKECVQISPLWDEKEIS